MLQIAQLVTIRSKAAERMIEFYRAQEAECEQVPLAPWRDERKLKASDIYVPMQLLTNRNPSPRLPPDLERAKQTEPKNTRLPRLQQLKKSPRKQNIKLGPNDELAESRYEDAKQKSVEQREPWEKVFRGTGLRLIFKGGAGSGKSFSLSQEVRQRLARARTELENFARPLYDAEIPIFVKASALVESNREHIDDAILATLPGLQRSVSSHLGNWWRHAFETQRGRRLLIVVDGLDELSESSQSRFREQTKQLEKLEAASLIVSCRTMYFEERRDWVSWAGDKRTKVLELAPLEDEQQIELIEKFIGPNDGPKESLLELLKKNYSLSHFCRTPFVLTSACLLFVEGQLSEKTSYDSLYKAVTEKMLKGDWRDLSQRPKWMRSKSEVLRDAAQQDRTFLLANICWHLFEASPSENRFTLKQWRKAYQSASTKQRAMDKRSMTKLDAARLLSELELVGMVINAGYSNQDKCYSFAHRTILEYFAARGLVEQQDRSAWVRTIVKHMWCESAWVEVIRFAASRVDDPTQLLRGVARETGSVSASPRMLQRLDGYCTGLAFLIVLILSLMVSAIGVALWGSELASSQASLYFSNLKQSLTNSFQTLQPITSNNLQTFRESSFEAPTMFIKDLTGLVYLLLSEILKYGRVLLDEFLKLYDFVFLLLHQVALQPGANGENLAEYVWILEWVRFLIPVLAATMLALMFLGSGLSWLDRKLFYRLSFAKQDDLFRTGLRVQAEVIGQNHVVSDQDVKQIVDELLASARAESNRMHGADEAGIPEDLLLLVGSNPKARRLLNDYWRRLAEKRGRKLNRLNWTYEKVLAGYLRALAMVRPKDASPLFTHGDFKNVGQLADRFTDNLYRRRYLTDSLSKYLGSKMPHDTGEMLKASNSKLTQEQLTNAFVYGLNEILQDPFLYDETEFKEITLRTETRDLLGRSPTGEELMRLNRLLLEDVYPKEIRKSQKRWVRFVVWFGRVAVKGYFRSRMWELRAPDPDLSRALRGMSLLPDEKNTGPLVYLLERNAITTKHLMNGGETSRTFTELDIYVAKALASAGDPRGKERLAEFAGRVEERNSNTPLAIKELGSVDEKLAIELAATCIKERWEAGSSYSYISMTKFQDVLLGLPFERVMTELTRLSIKEGQYFTEVLVPFLRRVGNETAKEWLQKTASENVHPSLAGRARGMFTSSYDKPWIDGAGWLEEQCSEIRKLLDKKDFDQAARKFHDLMYSYQFDYESDVWLDNLEKVAALCDEQMLDKWFDQNSSSYGAEYKNLVLLGKEAKNGKVVEEAIIQRVKNTKFNQMDGYGYGRRSAFLLALGDLGSKDAELTLLHTLREARSIPSRLWRHFHDNEGDIRRFYNLLAAGLGKFGSNAASQEEALASQEIAVQEIQRLLKYHRDWVAYYVAARVLAERDDPQALQLLLTGKGKRGSKDTWDKDFGDEPELRDFALRFGARITRVNHKGYPEYLAVSQSRNFKYRARA